MGNSLWDKFYALFKTVTKLEFRTLTTYVSRIINSKKRLILCVCQPAEFYKIHFDCACPRMMHRQAVLEHPREKPAQFNSSCLGFTFSQDAVSSCFPTLRHKLLFQLHLFNHEYC